MKCLIVKVKDRKRTPTYKKMISGKDVYSFPSNLDDAIEYSSSTLHEENEWYMITSFSKTTFCIELLKEDFSSVNYEKLSKSEVDSIDYLCSIQDDIFYFQIISYIMNTSIFNTRICMLYKYFSPNRFHHVHYSVMCYSIWIVW